MVRDRVAKGARLLHLICLMPQKTIHYPPWNVRNVHKEINHRHGKLEAPSALSGTTVPRLFPLTPSSISLLSPYSHQPLLVHSTCCVQAGSSSGEISSATTYVVRGRSQEGMGKFLEAKIRHESFPGMLLQTFRKNSHLYLLAASSLFCSVTHPKPSIRLEADYLHSITPLLGQSYIARRRAAAECCGSRDG